MRNVHSGAELLKDKYNSLLKENEKLKTDKEALEQQLILNDVVKSSCEHKAKLLTKKEVEGNRSSAYKYLDI